MRERRLSLGPGLLFRGGLSDKDAMAGLYRCRASLSEIAALFGARRPAAFDWSPVIWPGHSGLVILSEGSGRTIKPMHWGWPRPQRRGERGRIRETYVARDPLAPQGNRDDPVPPGRCLIVAESFAVPDGPKGDRTRAWFGLEAAPLFAWAGLWRQRPGDGPGYVGMVTAANPLVATIADAMPVILDSAGQEVWLHGSVTDLMRLQRPFPASAMYVEATDEPWPRRTGNARPTS
jgi:putative SOS response-associated peptidase YedK